ncbi:hypothetical protein JNE082640_p10140 (plasmid) [Escherichia coli]|nr:hypothetical protein JNE082640_p10140 [Escherichia coli]
MHASFFTIINTKTTLSQPSLYIRKKSNNPYTTTITTETTKKNKKIKTKNQYAKQNQKNTFKTEIKKIR